MTGRMERVKAALRSSSELCSLDDLYANALANARNDIGTLRRERNWGIESWWTAHEEGPAHCHYRLVRDPEQTTIWRVEDAEQLGLAV